MEEALSRPGALVFGWHYHYAGGGSRTRVRFHDYTSYLREVETARPGDHFTLFDLDTIAPHAFRREGSVDSSSGVSLSSDEWDDLRSRIEGEANEVVVVRRFIGPLTATVHSDVEEIWRPDDDEWVQFRSGLVWRPGEAVFFTDEVFDLAPDGSLIEAVTAYPNRRINALVDAKRPNAEGLVPRSGPY